MTTPKKPQDTPSPKTGPDGPAGSGTAQARTGTPNGPQNGPDGPQDGPADDQGQDGPDTFPAAVVRELRQENASLRVKGKRSDVLTSRLVEAMAATTGRLADPTDLPITDDLLDDEGMPDADKIEEAIDALLKKKPHLASTRPRYSDIGQGPRPGEQDVSLADILRAGA